MNKRVEKMLSRGWKHLGNKLWTPGVDDGSIRTRLPDSDPKAREIIQRLKRELPQAKIPVHIREIWQLQNDTLRTLFALEKSRIERLNDNLSNVMSLWHGTPNEETTKDGICHLGVNNSFWSQGKFGYGGYFAESAKKSHYFAKPNASSIRVLFLCDVAVGKFEELKGEAHGFEGQHMKNAPTPGYNSVKGVGHFPHTEIDEYVIFDAHQSIPTHMVFYEGGDVDAS